jgi:hypothetical protein
MERLDRREDVVEAALRVPVVATPERRHPGVVQSGGDARVGGEGRRGDAHHRRVQHHARHDEGAGRRDGVDDAGRVRLVHEEVDEAVDPGGDRRCGRIHSEGVRDGQQAEAVGLGDARGDRRVVQHGETRRALDGAVVDHELDVVGS